jgi:8-oxo-dGTP diphosphatase
MHEHEPGTFLAGVAGLIRNRDGAYLMMKRVAERDFGGDVWECVTGRVNQGEGFEEALHREVAEETGLRVTIDFIVGLTHFYRGEAIPQNELQGATFCCSIAGDETVAADAEHSEFRWMRADEAIAFLTAEDAGTRWFRRTIMRAEGLLRTVTAGWIDIHKDGVTIE